MAIVLSVAEKPSVAKELARIIGGDNVHRKNGFSPYNHIFEIPECDFKNGRCSMKITSVTGHMMEAEFETAYKSWNGCPPVDLFHAPISKSVKTESKEIEKTLVAESKKCNTLLLWLDGDLEGENICFEVMQVCLKVNPRMDVYRARFSALIQRDIFRTLRMPERPNKNMSDAVDARQEIDLRIGAAFTRFQTLRIQNKFDKISNHVISYGPCQFPTLGFVVERYLRIQAFVPSDFWTISCEYEAADADERNGKLYCPFNWDRTRLFDRLACTILFESCVQGDGIATVTSCQARPTSRQRPCPLNTIELQKRASNFFKMGSDRTMQVAEALYQRGILSYPRTETDFFKEGFELTPLIEEHRGNSLWGAFASDLMQNNKFLWPKAGSHDDQAHPPIHPTRNVELNDLEDPDEKKIYELVTIHFLACCAQDAKGNQTTICIEIPLGGECFTATGLMIIDRGWLTVYAKYEKWVAKKVPTFQVGDSFPVKKLEMTAGHTTAPVAISEADLIGEMDRNGIGTDATIAGHIKTIQQREYALKNASGQFVPTKLGLALVEGYNSMGLKLNKPYLRAAMEADCQKIVRGQVLRSDVVTACLKEMKTRFLQAVSQASKLDDAVSKFFGDFGSGNIERYRVIQNNFTVCGSCRSVMDIRVDVDDPDHENLEKAVRFAYCSTCKRGHKLPRGVLAPNPVFCAICSYQAVTVTKPDGKTHAICPQCFKNPPGMPHCNDASQDFRCFNCAHDTCGLAGRTVGCDVDVAPCTVPACVPLGAALRVTKGSKERGGFKICCSRKECARPPWWLPAFITSVIPLADVDCALCSQRLGYSLKKLKVSFNLSKSPRGTPPETVACPRCDRVWEDIHVTPLKLDPIGGGGNLGGGGGGGGGGGHGGSGINAGGGGRNGDAPGRGGASGPQNGNGMPGRVVEIAHATPYVRPAEYPANNGQASRAPDTSDYSAAATGVNIRKAMAVASASAGAGGTGGGKGGQGNASQDQNAPVCVCGGRAVCKVTTKEGPNKGRPFYTCPKPMAEQCKFFVWGDQDQGGGGGGYGGRGPGGGGTNSGWLPPLGNDGVCSKCRQHGHFARQCTS